MFLILSDEFSQKSNKSVILDKLLSYHERLKKGFPHLVTQPVIFEKSNTYFTIAFNGAIFTPDVSISSSKAIKANRNILVGDISNCKLRVSDSSESQNCTVSGKIAQKMCDKFAKCGTSIFSELEENFLLIGSKSNENSIHIATSPLGSRSIYWIEYDGLTFVTTELELLNFIFDGALRLSERGLASWLSGYPNPAISLFDNVNVLPIGHRLELSANRRPRIVKFWDIDPEHKISCQTQFEYSEQFFEIFQSSVKLACHTDRQKIVSQMSGGLDSTSVTALAKKHVERLEKEVVPLSHLYQQAEQCDESQLVEDMLSTLSCKESLKMTVDRGDDRNFLNLYPSHIESPGTVLSPRYHKELALVADSGADVLLTGNGGDEMCWGHSSAYTDRLKKGEVSVIKEVLKACHLVGMSKRQAIKNLFVKPFLPALFFKLMSDNKVGGNSAHVPIWLTDKAVSLALEETKIDNPFDERKDPVGYNRYQSLKTTSTYNAVHSYEKVAQQYGVDVRHPFFNPKLAEFTFAIPAKQLIQGPYPKWLLRHTMQDYLPQSVCWNLNKTTFDQHFGNLVRENATELRDILQDNRLADMGLVNPAMLLAEFDRVVSDPSLPVQVDLLYAILTFSWLNTHFPQTSGARE